VSQPVAVSSSRIYINDDECPRVHSTTLSSGIQTSGQEKSYNDECCRLRDEIAEVVSERERLERQVDSLHKTFSSKEQDLLARLHTAEHTVQLREQDLMHIHQQYQLLYQQFVVIQQQYNTLQQGSTSSQVADDDNMKTLSTLTQRLKEADRRCTELNEENSLLHRNLTIEQQQRLQAEELLQETKEQLNIYQQLSAHATEQRAVNVPEDSGYDYDSAPQSKLTLTGYRDIQQWFYQLRHGTETSSVMLGRTLRGHPRLRKSFVLYVLLIHLYVLFVCILHWI
jgi:hypothetical protein